MLLQSILMFKIKMIKTNLLLLQILTTESKSASPLKFSMFSNGILLTSLADLNVFNRNSSGVPCTNFFGKCLSVLIGVFPVGTSCFRSSSTKVLRECPRVWDWPENAVSKSFASWHLEESFACSCIEFLSSDLRWVSNIESRFDWDDKIADRASEVRDCRSKRQRMYMVEYFQTNIEFFDNVYFWTLYRNCHRKYPGHDWS